MTDRELKAMLEQAERRGVEQGIRLMQERILLACENGNPISINGKAYFIKSDIQNLTDIMDDIESAWNEEHRVIKFIVPLKKRSFNNEEITREVIIQAETAEMARVIAIGDFQHNNGWIVDMDCENYKKFKGQVKAIENGINHIKGTGRKRVYNFIVKFIKKKGYSPSIREISAGTGLKSTANVYMHLLKLEDEGKIEMKRKSTRAIKVIGFRFVEEESA